MKFKIFIICSVFLMLIFNTNSCKFPEDEMPQRPMDTATFDFRERGILLDTKTSLGLADAKVSVFAIITEDSIKLVQSGTTDSNGFFQLNFKHLKFNSGFLVKFEHINSVFMNRTYNTKNYREKVNDSTFQYYLHRKPGCRISLKNSDGKQKNVMVFNENKQFSKLLMNLRKDTSFVYLMTDFEDNIYMDYFPQKSLQKQPLRGSTSGDTLQVEFKY